MALYSILWKSAAERDLRRLDRSIIPRILEPIEALANNPFPLQCRKIVGSESIYRIRVGDYRVIYQVDDEVKTVIVYHVRHRKEAYR